MSTISVTTNALTLSPSPTPVPISTRVLSILATIWATLTTDNPLVWAFLRSSTHPKADMMGPYYVFDAPNVNFAPGKAVLGATEDLKNSPLFLFSGKVLGHNGEPLEATLDLWQANTAGQYGFARYRNRGKVTTDPSTGAFEVLTVPPGSYGIGPGTRVAHIHGIISAPGHQPLVTQFYLSPKNDPKAFDSDFVRYLRANQLESMMRGWTISTSQGDRYWDWPQLEDSDSETMKLVQEWNDRLSDRTELKITCGASEMVVLNRA